MKPAYKPEHNSQHAMDKLLNAFNPFLVLDKSLECLDPLYYVLNGYINSPVNMEIIRRWREPELGKGHK